MATRENNTMAEGCSKILKTITDMKIMPDADMPFLINLETNILDYLKPPVPQQPGQGGAPGQPGMDQMGPAMGQVMGGGMGGPGAGMPNPDELRRTLGQ